RPDRPASLCSGSYCKALFYNGERGERGMKGGDGGNAGKPGNGGDAGRINFRARHINGEVRLSVCRGHEAEAALNGRAGPVIRRKLGFLGKEGYDIFGNNKMFAPRIKWQSLEDTVEHMKNSAESYEIAFNNIMSIEQSSQDYKQIASKMTAATSVQINGHLKRLKDAKSGAESEKQAYVKVSGYSALQEQMNGILTNIANLSPQIYARSRFQVDDFLAVLQGIAGFASGIASRDPFTVIDSVIGLAGATYSLVENTCFQSLQLYMGSVKRWLTFGQHYKPLADSSDLDFDQLDVSSVPQIMQANLDINKEKFAAELVCLLDVASDPKEVAVFTQHLESFFILASARIDLIAEVMTLDGDIGGCEFDISLTEQTEKALKEATETPGKV
ncbi:unnamed protein product, partial [Porites evermanni]